MNLAGILLCGGASRRMGRSKADLPFGEGVLLQWTARRLLPAVAELIVVAGPDQPLPALPADVRIARDPVACEGPLRGLASGLEQIDDSFDLAFLAAVDMPFIRGEFIARLATLIGAADIAMPVIDQRIQPIGSLYRRRVLPLVHQLLAQGERRLHRLSSLCAVRQVAGDELADATSLANLNTPDDYQRALAWLRNLSEPEA